MSGRHTRKSTAKAKARRKRLPRNAKMLKARRKRLGLTQEQLGVLLGTQRKPLPLATISRWECGETIQHVGILFLALDALEAKIPPASPTK